MLDTKLVVKPALEVMWQAGVVSAPLWQSTPPELLGNSSTDDASTAASQAQDTTSPSEPQGEEKENKEGKREGDVSPKSLQTSSKPKAPPKHTTFRLRRHAYRQRHHPPHSILLPPFLLRLGSFRRRNVPPRALTRYRTSSQCSSSTILSVHPLRPLFDACQLLIKTHARRLPLLDYDEQTGMETVVSVLTQYRVLKFIAMNCRETGALWRSLRQCGIGTYCQHYRASMAATTARGSASGSTSHRGSDASEPGIVKSEFGEKLNMSELAPEGAVATEEEEEGKRRESDASAASSTASRAAAAAAAAATAHIDRPRFHFKPTSNSSRSRHTRHNRL